MKNAPLNKVNPHFKSRYADLAAIRDATIPALSKHGLAIAQYMRHTDGVLVLVTRLMHESGEALEGEYPLPAAADKPQVMGSALTYGKRYSWASMVGISADDDDDGNAASAKPAAPVQAAAPPPTYITANQHRALEAQISELEIDRERVKSWVGRRWQIAEPHLNQLTEPQWHALMDMLPKFAAAQAPA
jgi:hypothetical protein